MSFPVQELNYKNYNRTCFFSNSSIMFCAKFFKRCRVDDLVFLFLFCFTFRSSYNIVFHTAVAPGNKVNSPPPKYGPGNILRLGHGKRIILAMILYFITKHKRSYRFSTNNSPTVSCLPNENIDETESQIKKCTSIYFLLPLPVNIQYLWCI